MLEGGEDPLYVARRMVRMAAEDIGTADPAALPLVCISDYSC
jgi:putative ATPase